VTSNPYQSPAAADTASSTSPGGSLRRPTGVTLVAVVLILIGGGGVWTLLTMAMAVGFFPSILFWDLVYVLPGVIAGVELIRGKTWGWVLATLLAMTRVFYHGSAVLALLQLAMPDMMLQFSANLTGIAIFGPLLVYLYKPHVVEYFRLPRNKRLAMLGGQSVLSILFLIGVPVLRRFL
jgi:hypothetical protein